MSHPPLYLIRQETPQDHKAVFELIEEAFRELVVSDHQEQFLVERLRLSQTHFVPQLSLVAHTLDGEIIGHILLTKCHILQPRDRLHQRIESLALAPLSVKPTFQRKGIGAALVHEAHSIATQLGFTSVVVVGHPDYYPKFGYRPAKQFGIAFPFEVPDECGMVIELQSGALKECRGGIVEYAPEFQIGENKE
ncbi:hypothetical protein FDP41_009051 [Naegleria fowleri]|uniref:N-acetyltransferase domain-containing protein n=1 Tax=Naegleria fowleri TaxID=5763 RepID=A0A6A5BD65_NAEFO|nr:uncharacterized protein FDP41_009051 [Naegleria fowleri]KAF0972802.1 hypothetical protein FDP41_009051 [Naegleria fowleri]CAG4713563.1 unnamed protein product [Naegleria fowleri]